MENKPGDAAGGARRAPEYGEEGARTRGRAEVEARSEGGAKVRSGPAGAWAAREAVRRGVAGSRSRPLPARTPVARFDPPRIDRDDVPAGPRHEGRIFLDPVGFDFAVARVLRRDVRGRGHARGQVFRILGRRSVFRQL